MDTSKIPIEIWEMISMKNSNSRDIVSLSMVNKHINKIKRNRILFQKPKVITNDKNAMNIWKCISFEKNYFVPNHMNCITANDNYIFASSNSEIYRFDLNNYDNTACGIQYDKIYDNEVIVTCMTATNDYLFVGCEDGQTLKLHTESFKMLQIFISNSEYSHMGTIIKIFIDNKLSRLYTVTHRTNIYQNDELYNTTEYSLQHGDITRFFYDINIEFISSNKFLYKDNNYKIRITNFRMSNSNEICPSKDVLCSCSNIINVFIGKKNVIMIFDIISGNIVNNYFCQNLLCMCADNDFLYIRTKTDIQKIVISSGKISKRWEVHIPKMNSSEYIYLKNNYLYINIIDGFTRLHI